MDRSKKNNIMQIRLKGEIIKVSRRIKKLWMNGSLIPIILGGTSLSHQAKNGRWRKNNPRAGRSRRGEGGSRWRRCAHTVTRYTESYFNRQFIANHQHILSIIIWWVILESRKEQAWVRGWQGRRCRLVGRMVVMIGMHVSRCSYMRKMNGQSRGFRCDTDQIWKAKRQHQSSTRLTRSQKQTKAQLKENWNASSVWTWMHSPSQSTSRFMKATQRTICVNHFAESTTWPTDKRNTIY